MKAKCWELEKCKKIECPVYGKTKERCWLVSGTYCRDEIQGMFLNKIEICLKCDVFKQNVSTDEKEWWHTLDFADRQFKQYVKKIEEQRNSIIQLSTPVIPIWNKILVLPLIGVLDEERALRLIDNLLKRLSETRALVAIIDITGIIEIDPFVAKYLSKTSRTAYLMGCRCLFTGISPENAKILESSGINLSDIVIKTTLQEGLEMAFELTKIRLVKES